jgi:hypothetical protein
MEGLFTGQTDPRPYLVAAYAVGLSIMISLPFWFRFQKMRYEKILELSGPTVDREI